MSLRLRRNAHHRPVRRGAALAYTILLIGASVAARGARAPGAVANELFARHCVGCHGGERTNAGVDLSADVDELTVWGERSKYARVLRAVEGHLMPPERTPRPLPEDDRARLVEWLAHTLDNVEVERIPPDPGTVPPRRLNRSEHMWSVEDLFGIEVDLTVILPAEQVFGDGFDNDAAVLSFDELRFERSLAAADEVVRAVWGDPAALERLIFVRPSPKLPDEKAAYVATDDETASCRTDAGSFTIVARFVAAEGMSIFSRTEPGSGYEPGAKSLTYDPGSDSLAYAIRRDRPLRALSVGIDDAAPHTVALRVHDATASLFLDGRLLVRQADFVRGDRDGHRLKIGPRNVGPDDPEPEEDSPGVEELRCWQVPLSEETVTALTGGDGSPDADVPAPAFHWLPGHVAPLPEDFRTDNDAAREVLAAFLRGAFRRQPHEAEIDRYVDLFDEGRAVGLPFDVALQLPVRTALVSPSFLFRGAGAGVGTGAGIDLEPGIQPIPGLDMANRLSYFLWSSGPDEDLLDEAARGTLATDDGLRAAVARLLDDPRAHRFYERFTLQWLRTEGLGESIRPDSERFPDVDDELLEDMKREGVLVFADVFGRNRPVLELLDRKTTFVNDRLAAHYRLDVASTSDWRSVDVDPRERGGLLTQAAVLTVSSSPRRTSPVFRGKWVLEVLLGEPSPAPPADVPDLQESQVEAGATLRELLALHRERATCAACHDLIDPYGLALEQYDAVGRRRPDPRDTSAVLPGGTEVDGAADLRRLLADERSATFLRHLTRRLLVYALGRDLILADERAVAAIAADVEARGGSSRALVEGIVLSDPFRYRRVE